MIHLPLKDILNPPPKLLQHKALEQLRKSILVKDGRLITTTYYKDKEIVNILKGLSIHKKNYDPKIDTAKCNYCESQIGHGATLQVEHYRPKASVRAVDNNGKAHPGYYWLGLEWSNLLLSCPTCNGKSAKSDRFPIGGKRAIETHPVCDLLILDRTLCMSDKTPLIDEKPLLINPEVDQPENFFTFDITGKIFGYGKDALRGDISVGIYTLNRPELKKERLKVWTEIKNKALENIAEFETCHKDIKLLKRDFNGLCKSLLKRKDIECEFTLWGRFINENILDFIIADIPNHYQMFFLDEYLPLI